MASKKKDRALYDAVKKSDADHVARLLQEGANPDSPVGKKGMTAMQRAVALPTRDIEKLLQAKGGTLFSTSTLRRPVDAPVTRAGSEVSAADAGKAGDAGTVVVKSDIR